jgi:hypothetical protein
MQAELCSDVMGLGGGGGRENIGAAKTERDKLKRQQAIAL